MNKGIIIILAICFLIGCIMIETTEAQFGYRRGFGGFGGYGRRFGGGYGRGFGRGKSQLECSF